MSPFTKAIGLPTIVNDDLNLKKQCEGAKGYVQQASWDRTLDVTGSAHRLIVDLNQGAIPFTGP